MIDLNLFAKQRWTQGDRDEKSVAEAYVQAALAAEDPSAYLVPAIKQQVAEEFRRYRNSVEDDVFPLQDPDTPITETETKRATVRHPRGGNYRKGWSRHDRMLLLLETEVWTSTKGLIPWKELTVSDITETIAAYETQISGVKYRIEKLEQARTLMDKYGVEQFGSIPWEGTSDVAQLVEA
jgi:hypothetical protein